MIRTIHERGKIGWKTDEDGRSLQEAGLEKMMKQIGRGRNVGSR